MTAPVPSEGLVLPFRSWLAWAMKAFLSLFLLWITLRKVPLQGIKAAAFQVHAGQAALLNPGPPGRVLVLGTHPPGPGWATAARKGNPGSWNGWRFFLESRPFFHLLPGAVASEGMVWLRLRRFQWRHFSCGFVLANTRIWGVAAWGSCAAYALTYSSGARILAHAPNWLSTPALWACGALLAAAVAMIAPRFVKHGNSAPVKLAPLFPAW